MQLHQRYAVVHRQVELEYEQVKSADLEYLKRGLTVCDFLEDDVAGFTKLFPLTVAVNYVDVPPDNRTQAPSLRRRRVAPGCTLPCRPSSAFEFVIPLAFGNGSAETTVSR
jgi:hypothetical protein